MQQVRPLLAAILTFAIAGTTVAQNEINREEPGFGLDPRVSKSPVAPILPGMGTHSLPVTTSSKEAQRFFDQGLALTYAYNHAEAKRSFQEAARLDPNCAMAYWGWALVLGPNLNLPMMPDAVDEAYWAIQQANKHLDGTSAKEKAFIEALTTRYSKKAVDDRMSFDIAYHEAMKEVYAAYPGDADVASLYAATIMNLSPWNYWTKDASPRQRTQDAMAVLKKTVEAHSNHAGALHYYVHLVEEHYPELAEVSADSLIKVMPGSGHLLHMPSHIYMRVGRYADAFESNRLAVLADEGYITACREQGLYPAGYYPHNIHFQAWAAQREGRSDEALKASFKVGNKARESAELGQTWALHQSFYSMPYYTLVRFGKWDEMLRQPPPPKTHIFARGVFHMGRGLAYIEKGQSQKASKELAMLRKVVGNKLAAEEFVGFSNAQTVLKIAENVLAGELALAGNRDKQALELLSTATRLEDSLMYNEPPDWLLPTRHNLGNALLEMGKPAEAETVYWEDLKRNPDNGYSLFGLHNALVAQEKSGDAELVKGRFDDAWAKADVQLTSSRY